ncbi:hypothetical protein RFI_29969 [Reticulomyxa filosa]|uniref:Uncharacterized protein n=1 Tax=Reticulomyxa filosa TaxID=46433 RepID=X6M1G1_RETFI|nr:hypothetical protein RFI_29969 [Reticulomyxa filosa]|eukprot:ETO07421.1 hypothetical protein RFI_29969 [Reticulomyxa filosa]
MLKCKKRSETKYHIDSNFTKFLKNRNSLLINIQSIKRKNKAINQNVKIILSKSSIDLSMSFNNPSKATVSCNSRGFVSGPFELLLFCDLMSFNRIQNYFASKKNKQKRSSTVGMSITSSSIPLRDIFVF